MNDAIKLTNEEISNVVDEISLNEIGCDNLNQLMNWIKNYKQICKELSLNKDKGLNDPNCKLTKYYMLENSEYGWGGYDTYEEAFKFATQEKDKNPEELIKIVHQVSIERRVEEL